MQTNLNTKEEIVNGFVVTEKRKKVWAIELDLLKELINVCDRNGLRMFVSDGSLLGAIRHQGFIPWDDDIDVSMPRKDYDKLMEIGPTEFKHPYFFQSAYTDKYYYRGHVQIRNCETTGAIPEEHSRKFNQGIFIDIFPLDILPESKDGIADLKTKSAAMREIMFYYRHIEISLALRASISSFFKCLRSEIIIHNAGGLTKYYSRYEDMFRRYSGTNSGKLTTLSSFSVDYSFPAVIFKETVFVDFQGIRIPVMAGYDEYLRILYGDYMTPQQGGSLHGNPVFDTEVPYTVKLKRIHKIFGFGGQFKRQVLAMKKYISEAKTMIML